MHLLTNLHIKGLLSFEDSEVKLQALNVLIGPNGTGKSNLLEAVAVLRSAPEGLPEMFRQSGGFGEWLWKGSTNGARDFSLETVLVNPTASTDMPLRYRLRLGETGQGFTVLEESLANERPYPGHDKPYMYFEVKNGAGVLNVLQKGKAIPRKLLPDTLSPGQSVLHERRDPDQYPEITMVAKRFDTVRLYREWNLGRNTAPRRPQPADLPNQLLDESFSNLALVLNRLERDGSIERIEHELTRFYPQFSRLNIQITGGTAQLFVKERGIRSLIPATRLSDGTLRFISLLAILLDPEPPPLICIEEPELGLHPDVLAQVAQLLRDAAKRTQVIVPTHSDVLIDGLSDTPEAVLVCDRDPVSGTSFTRLSRDHLGRWLQEYRLGHLWRKGQLGGNRW